jgi:hypothetical protein
MCVHRDAWFAVAVAASPPPPSPARFAYVYVDGVMVWKQSMNAVSGTHVCGNSAKDQFIPVSLTVAHYAQAVTVRVQSGLSSDATEESWGIANFKITTVMAACTGVTYQSDFTSDGTEGWQFTNALVGSTSTCDGEVLLGGYKDFGIGAEAVIDIDMATAGHGVIIAFTFVQIDSWCVFVVVVVVVVVVAAAVSVRWFVM